MRYSGRHDAIMMAVQIVTILLQKSCLLKLMFHRVWSEISTPRILCQAACTRILLATLFAIANKAKWRNQLVMINNVLYIHIFYACTCNSYPHAILMVYSNEDD